MPNSNPIRVLPRELALKIAAGEVVERPGSVVKELIENSLDADARHIRIELEEGGRRRIAVEDDGVGIADDQVLTALERHATSKIASLDDLWNLHTMGFRGEALPSIAAVSRLTVETHAKNSNGRKVYLEGGKLLKDLPPGPQRSSLTGTLVMVENLFFNVPARLKFLKAKSSENALVREIIERVALCNPAVGFTYVTDGRKSLSLEPDRDASQPNIKRVTDVFETLPENIESFESVFEDIQIRGWLDRDERARNSRSIFLSVNGRPVRDKLLQQAILTALRPRMMEGEFPKIYLAVDVPPSEVDANVHPAKMEVRFEKSRDIFQVIHGALSRLASQPSRAFYSVKQMGTPTQQSPTTPNERACDHIAQPRLFASDRVVYRTKDHVSINVGGLTASFETGALNRPSDDLVSSSPGFRRLQYIGQVKNTYLLFQDSDGLILIDQHAAHERINYERIKADFMKNGLKPQPLLMSAVLKCKAEDLALALDHADDFARLGFEFEAFGDQCILIRSAPEGLAPDRASELFKSLLETTTSGEENTTDPTRISAKLERWLSTSACHSSIRAGQPLSPQEARDLAAQMDTTASSLNCPHGRPASIRLTFNQIEGLFKRG